MMMPENPKRALIDAVFEKMVDFRPEPTDSTSFEGQYLIDTGKMLIDLSRKIETATSENYIELLNEVEDFGFYVRDPKGYQRSLDEKVEAEKRIREAEKEEKRRAKEEKREEERRIKAIEREEKRRAKAEERIGRQVRTKPDLITENVEEVNGLLEAML